MFRSLADVLLPPKCASCDAFGESPLCASCTARIRWIDAACEKCAAPKRRRGACGECAARSHLFTRAASAAIYEGPARDAIVAFKLLGERRSATAMAGWLIRPARHLRRPDVLTWVPGTRKSAVERGFVPAREIARAFARLTKIRPAALLAKTRETADQHGLDAQARFANLAGAFRGRDAAGSVLLVDDVLTTGATAAACAKALIEAGAAEVQVLTVARAPLRRSNQDRSNSPFPATGSGARM